MDSGQSWSDFHFLNTAFSDVVEAGKAKWVETPLVRLSYRGSKDSAINRTIKAIDGLIVEYAVPFPLTYIFGPQVHQVYGSIFVFLLQVRRAKSLLERILVRGAMTTIPHLGNELKVFYAMRSKLSWFVK
jgi:gamma-tubulin complex component 5